MTEVVNKEGLKHNVSDEDLQRFLDDGWTRTPKESASTLRSKKKAKAEE